MGRKHPQQECIQIDTTNVLFICGGAFNGIEDTISRRIGKKTMGFGADIQTNVEKDIGSILKNILPRGSAKVWAYPRICG